MPFKSPFPGFATAAQMYARTARQAMNPGNQFAQFFAYRTTDQTGIANSTKTVVQFNTELYDVGGFYDSVTNFSWTPPAGNIRIGCSGRALATIAAGNQFIMEIQKNGAGIYQGIQYAISANDVMVVGQTRDTASGSDVYVVKTFIVTAATGSLQGNIQTSYFYGDMQQ